MVAMGCGGLSNEDWNDTAVRVVVLSPSGEVWCGVGSHAESLGIFTDAAVMAAQIADRCDTPSAKCR